MTGGIAEVVNWRDLGNSVVVSLVAGVGISAGYGFARLGVVRAREHGDAAQAAVYGLIGLAGPIVTLGGIALGLIFMAAD